MLRRILSSDIWLMAEKLFSVCADPTGLAGQLFAKQVLAGENMIIREEGAEGRRKMVLLKIEGP